MRILGLAAFFGGTVVFALGAFVLASCLGGVIKICDTHYPPTDAVRLLIGGGSLWGSLLIVGGLVLLYMTARREKAGVSS